MIWEIYGHSTDGLTLMGACVDCVTENGRVLVTHPVTMTAVAGGVVARYSVYSPDLDLKANLHMECEPIPVAVGQRVQIVVTDGMLFRVELAAKENAER